MKILILITLLFIYSKDIFGCKDALKLKTFVVEGIEYKCSSGESLGSGAFGEVYALEPVAGVGEKLVLKYFFKKSTQKSKEVSDLEKIFEVRPKAPVPRLFKEEKRDPNFHYLIKKRVEGKTLGYHLRCGNFTNETEVLCPGEPSPADANTMSTTLQKFFKKLICLERDLKIKKVYLNDVKADNIMFDDITKKWFLIDFVLPGLRGTKVDRIFEFHLTLREDEREFSWVKYWKRNSEYLGVHGKDGIGIIINEIAKKSLENINCNKREAAN